MATSNVMLSSCELLGIAWLFYYHYSVINKIVHVSLASRCENETSLHIRGPFSKLNRFLPVAFSQRTHPLLPTGSLVPLASSPNVLTSPWLARNLWPLLFSRPITCPRRGVPSRLNSTVYVCSYRGQWTIQSISGAIETRLTSITASPSAFTSTAGAGTSVTTSGSGGLSGYGDPSRLGLDDRQITCW